MATRQEISDITHKGKQWDVGRVLTIEELSELDLPCPVWINGKVWTLAPIKYTKCLRLKHTKADLPQFNDETRKVERENILEKKELPLTEGVEIREAIQLEGDDRLFPVDASEAYLPIQVAFEDYVSAEKTDDDMPYLNVTSEVGVLLFRVIYFGKTERYIVYKPALKPDEFLGEKVNIVNTAGEVITFIRENI